MHTGVTSVGVVVDKEVGQAGLREYGARGFLEAQIAQAPHVRRLLDGATLAAEPEVERDWSYTSSSFAGDGYVLVGDAACFLDPLFSSGVHLALGGATLAATYVRTALANPASRAQAAQAYHSLYDKQYQYFRLTAQLFYGTNRSADSYFWEARRILGDDDATPRAAFVKVVGGQTPQGYERAVIERGVVPAGLLDEVGRMEAWFQQRKESTEALLRDPSALLRAVPTLAAQMRLEEKPVLGTAGLHAGLPDRLDGAGGDHGRLSGHGGHRDLHRQNERPAHGGRDHRRGAGRARAARRRRSDGHRAARPAHVDRRRHGRRQRAIRRTQRAVPLRIGQEIQALPRRRGARLTPSGPRLSARWTSSVRMGISDKSALARRTLSDRIRRGFGEHAGRLAAYSVIPNGHTGGRLMASNYWSRMRARRVSRRTLLKASGAAGVGAAGIALVGCGGDDDDDDAAPAPAPAAAAAEEQAERAGRTGDG